MIDTTVEPSYAAFERDQARREAARVRPLRRAVPAGALTTLPSSPSELAARGTLVVETAAHEEVAEPPRPAAEPLEHLRTARLGFAAAVVLALCALWIRQQRRK